MDSGSRLVGSVGLLLTSLFKLFTLGGPWVQLSLSLIYIPKTLCLTDSLHRLIGTLGQYINAYLASDVDSILVWCAADAQYALSCSLNWGNHLGLLALLE